MAIKNPHIIHFVRKRKEGYYKGEYAYICCGSYTKEKSTRKEREVICKNCLRVLEKEKGGKK